jgi:hypothetical protein
MPSGVSTAKQPLPVFSKTSVASGCCLRYIVETPSRPLQEMGWLVCFPELPR